METLSSETTSSLGRKAIDIYIFVNIIIFFLNNHIPPFWRLFLNIFVYFNFMFSNVYCVRADKQGADMQVVFSQTSQ